MAGPPPDGSAPHPVQHGPAESSPCPGHHSSLVLQSSTTSWVVGSMAKGCSNGQPGQYRCAHLREVPWEMGCPGRREGPSPRAGETREQKPFAAAASRQFICSWREVQEQTQRPSPISRGVMRSSGQTVSSGPFFLTEQLWSNCLNSTE